MGKLRCKDYLRHVLTAIVVIFIYASLVAAFRGTPLLALSIIVLFVAGIIFGEKIKRLEEVYKLLESNRKLATVMIIICLAILPILLENNYDIHVAVIAGINALVALSLNFQLGSAGMVNVAPAAFMGMGAYTSAFLSVKLGFDPWLATAMAIFSSALLGLIVGYPTLKTRGYYLALVTIAIQVIFTLLIINTPSLGGPNGISGIPSYEIGSISFGKELVVGNFHLSHQVYYLYLVTFALMFTVWIAGRLWNSRIGLAWNAIEQDEVVAATQGINVAYMKLLAFTLGGAFAGLAGAIYGHYSSFVGIDDFGMNKSLIILCMVALGGMDNVMGVVLGAVVLTLVDEKLRELADYGVFFYGIILIAVLLMRPQGILPRRMRKYQRIELQKPVRHFTAEAIPPAESAD